MVIWSNIMATMCPEVFRVIWISDSTMPHNYLRLTYRVPVLFAFLCFVLLSYRNGVGMSVPRQLLSESSILGCLETWGGKAYCGFLWWFDSFTSSKASLLYYFTTFSFNTLISFTQKHLWSACDVWGWEAMTKGRVLAVSRPAVQ